MAQKKEYTASEKVQQAQAAVEAHENTKPETFSSAYDGALRQVMDRILNREDFHYNLAGDALYRQYRNQAVQNGRLAMEDTLGRAATLTGGYGNSYAQSVGQQAYHRELAYTSNPAELSYANVQKLIKNAVRQTERYRIMKKSGFSEEEIDKAFHTPYEMDVFA